MRPTGEKVRSCFRSAAGGKVRVSFSRLATPTPLRQPLTALGAHSSPAPNKPPNHRADQDPRSHRSSPQPYTTELDLLKLDLPATAVQFLLEKIDRYEARRGEDGELDVEAEDEEGALDYEEFLERFLEA